VDTPLHHAQVGNQQMPIARLFQDTRRAAQQIIVHCKKSDTWREDASESIDHDGDEECGDWR
jgi:hypothetical protein